MNLNDDLPSNYLELICLYVYIAKLVAASPSVLSEDTISEITKAQGKVLNFANTLPEHLTIEDILKTIFTKLNNSNTLH